MTIAIEFLHPLKGEVPPPDTFQRARLDGLSACLIAAQSLDEAFEILATNLPRAIPFDRLGLAALTDGGSQLRSVRVQSSHAVHWAQGDTRPLLGSSLQPMIRERAVRLIHDLKAYQTLRPSSLSTKRLIEEGMRSSLSIPLFDDDRPIGVLFITRATPDAYHLEHASLLVALAPALNTAFGRLLSAKSLAMS